MQPSSSRIGLFFLLALIAVAAWFVIERPVHEPRSPRDVVAGVATPAAPAPAIARSEPARAAPSTPVTPVYTTRAEPAPAAPIYRCRVGSRTVYTQEACDDGRVVETANAVGGFETKPSDGLQRLVADGRGPVEPSVAPAPAARVVAKRTSALCATYAQQVRDLDGIASMPNDADGQDRIRRIRQDVRTSMARERC